MSLTGFAEYLSSVWTPSQQPDIPKIINPTAMANKMFQNQFSEVLQPPLFS
jgi:hypothetical protein